MSQSTRKTLFLVLFLSEQVQKVKNRLKKFSLGIENVGFGYRQKKGERIKIIENEALKVGS
jgi:hypothetical protein